MTLLERACTAVDGLRAHPVQNLLRAALLVLLVYRTYVWGFTDEDWYASAWAAAFIVVMFAYSVESWRMERHSRSSSPVSPQD